MTTRTLIPAGALALALALAACGGDDRASNGSFDAPQVQAACSDQNTGERIDDRYCNHDDHDGFVALPYYAWWYPTPGLIYPPLGGHLPRGGSYAPPPRTRVVYGGVPRAGATAPRVAPPRASSAPSVRQPSARPPVQQRQAPAPRVQQPAPRVQAPAPRVNPAPAPAAPRYNPPARVR